MPPLTPVRDRTRTALVFWLGFSLAALFFYPLASALEGDRYYLQWQPRHTAEALTAIAILAVAWTLALFAAIRVPGRRGALALLLVAALPIASVGVGVARQLPLRDTLIPLWEQPHVRYLIPAAAAGLGLVVLVVRPAVVSMSLWVLLVLLSPASLLVLKALIVAGMAPGVRTSVETTMPDRPGASGRTCSSVLAFVFDELSAAYLYDGTKVRPEFTSIARFAGSSTNYLAVSAPAPETMVSLPAFLAARRPHAVRIQGAQVLEVLPDGRSVPFVATAEDGLFAASRRLGFRNEIAGYYFAYCELLAGLVDACRSDSFYNVAGTREWFSPLNPVLTTLVLWPRQFPFGLLKNPPFALQQRGMVRESLAFAKRPVPAETPIFRLIHFSVPHLPFVFDENGYNPPFDPLRTSPDDAYVSQIGYVDRLFGEVLAHLQQGVDGGRSTVVLLSDHGFRFGGRERDPLHVPFLVRTPGQRERIDVPTPARAEVLLKQVLAGACEP